MTPELNASSLPADFETPTDQELLLPDVYVGLEIDLLAPGDGVVTDRHHASADNYEADDPMNQIEGQISPFTLSGWLRHGCEAVLQDLDTTACHPGEPNAEFRRANVYDRDLESGYHEKGACTDAYKDGCTVYDLFGGFGDNPGKLLRRPVTFSPIRRNVDVLSSEAEAHYRQLSTQVRSRNGEDGGKPLRQTDRDVLGNVEGTWKLTLRETKPEFAFQIGGARNFGAGDADVGGRPRGCRADARTLRRVRPRGLHVPSRLAAGTGGGTSTKEGSAMSEGGEASMTITGTGEVASAVGYEVEHVELDDGETQLVRLTFDLWELSASVGFHIDQAEDSLVRFRNEIVHAKQAQLEWETNTDPETGIAEECE